MNTQEPDYSSMLDDLRRVSDYKCRLYLCNDILQIVFKFHKNEKKYRSNYEVNKLKGQQRKLTTKLAANVPEVGTIQYPHVVKPSKHFSKRLKFDALFLLFMYFCLILSIVVPFPYPLLLLGFLPANIILIVIFVRVMMPRDDIEKCLEWSEKNVSKVSRDNCLSANSKTRFINEFIKYDCAYLAAIEKNATLNSEIKEKKSEPKVDAAIKIYRDYAPTEYEEVQRIKKELQNCRFKNEPYPGILLEILENRLASSIDAARALAKEEYAKRLKEIKDHESFWWVKCRDQYPDWSYSEVSKAAKEDMKRAKELAKYYNTDDFRRIALEIDDSGIVDM